MKLRSILLLAVAVTFEAEAAPPPISPEASAKLSFHGRIDGSICSLQQCRCEQDQTGVKISCNCKNQVGWGKIMHWTVGLFNMV